MIGEIFIAGESGDAAVLVVPEDAFVVETGDNDVEVLQPPEDKPEGAKQQ